MREIGKMKSIILIPSLFFFQSVAFIQSSQPCPTNCICSLLENSLSSATCNEFPHLEEFNEDLHILKIESSKLCPISRNLQKFTQLKALSVSNCAIDVNSNSFKNLPHLESVTFHNTGIMNFDPSFFEFNHNLKTVNLSSNPLKIWRHLLVSASVEEIDLSNCDLSDVPKKAFSQILNLKRLILRNNRLKTLNTILPDSVNYLDLSNNVIEDLSLQALKPLVNLNEIEIFDNPLVCSCKLKLIEKYLSFKNVFIAKPVECIAHSKEVVPLNTLALRDVCKLRPSVNEDVFVAKLLQRLRRSVATTNDSFEELSSWTNETETIDSQNESLENTTQSAYRLDAKMNFKDDEDGFKMVVDEGFVAKPQPNEEAVESPPEKKETSSDKGTDSDEKTDSKEGTDSGDEDGSLFSLKGVILFLALIITLLLLLVIAIVVALILKMLQNESDDESSAAAAACVASAHQENGDNEEECQIPMLSRRCSTRKGTCRICPSTMSSRRSRASSCKCSSRSNESDCETVANESQFDCSTMTSASTTFERSRRC